MKPPSEPCIVSLSISIESSISYSTDYLVLRETNGPAMSEEFPPTETANAATAIVRADLYTEHDAGSGHPESPDRYTAIIGALENAEFASRLSWLDPPAVDGQDIARCHARRYIDLARREILSGAPCLSTGDTTVTKWSWEPALHAAGGACAAVDAVIESEAKNAFCVVRPPGHHAMSCHGMGFCVFNNIAIAARYAQHKHGVGKVLIADWDVHHGNGTQEIFYDDDSVFFFSTHQWPWYPGSGADAETGQGRGMGATLNRPFSAGAGRSEILAAFGEDMRSAAQKFKPELILVSAGFDSRIDDPLGDFQLTDDDFADLTRLMLDLADEYANGHVISLLEGGYNIPGLASAATAHCRALVNHG